MFAFGDREWPGLAKLAEEAGEVVQVVAKLVMTHGSVTYWDEPPLDERLVDEMADLHAALGFVLARLSPEMQRRFYERAAMKRAKFEDWHKERTARAGAG